MTLFQAFLLIVAVLAILRGIWLIKKAYSPRVSYKPRFVKIQKLPDINRMHPGKPRKF